MELEILAAHTAHVAHHLAGEAARAVEHVEALAAGYAAAHEFGNPVFYAFLAGSLAQGEADEDHSHARGHGVGVVELYLVVALAVDFAGECAQHHLEEAVDGADVEMAVVVEHLAQGRGGLCGELGLRAAEEGCEGGGIVGPGAVARQGVELAHDARLHLVGGLVGEGDGEYALVAVALPAPCGRVAR